MFTDIYNTNNFEYDLHSLPNDETVNATKHYCYFGGARVFDFGICKKCGEELKENYRFCPVCGKRIKWEDEIDG